MTSLPAYGDAALASRDTNEAPADRIVRGSSAARTALLVTGMHRSGTSALARTLSLLGAALPEDLVPPNAGNPKGHWEPSAMVALNDRMLADARSDLYSAVDIDPAWFASPSAEAFAAEAAALAVASFRGDLIVLKDPRTAVLAPIWNRALAEVGYRVAHVLPLRHPADVAESLRRRHLKDFPYDAWVVPRGEAVWLRYTLAAVRGARGHGSAFIRYGDLLADWRAAIRRIDDDLTVAWPHPRERAEAAVDAFLHGNEKADGQRPLFDVPADLDALGLSELAAALYAVLCRSGDGPAVDAIAASYERRMKGTRDLLLAFEDLYPLVWRFYEDGRVTADRLDLALAAEAEIRGNGQRTWAALTRANSDKLALQQGLASREQQLAGLEAAKAGVQGQIAQHAAEADAQRVRADAGDAERQRLTAALSASQAAVAAADDQLAALRRSTSWRLTAPIRFIARTLLGRA